MQHEEIIRGLLDCLDGNKGELMPINEIEAAIDLIKEQQSDLERKGKVIQKLERKLYSQADLIHQLRSK